MCINQEKAYIVGYMNLTLVLYASDLILYILFVFLTLFVNGSDLLQFPFAININLHSRIVNIAMIFCFQMYYLLMISLNIIT